MGGSALFVLGDLFTALIRTGKTVALAVFQATGITHKNRKLSSVSAAELALESADISISGQVLHLVMPSLPPHNIVMSGDLPKLLKQAPSSANSSIDKSRLMGHNTSISVDNLLVTTTSSVNPSSDDQSLHNNSPTLFWIGNYTKFNPLRARGTWDQYMPHRVGGGPAEPYQTFWTQNLIN